ncbi:Dabb family protein [Actimicrobium antarcticum]|uniref:Dabb family protein n=1 Tax=Actimicrobium antarcticum TaxID=1051899 RepID=A0ABP7SGK8_9BURK
MIKHIVMWTLKDQAEGNDKATNLLQMKVLLESCRDIVPGMRKFEVSLAQPGLECTCDILLDSEFDTAHALDDYQSHPVHLATKPFIGAVRETRHCMDVLSEAPVSAAP